MAITAFACRTFAQPVNFPRPQSPEFCKVSGVVKDAVSGQPIERALVDGQMDAGLTDNEGRFELHLPCGGSTQLLLKRPGYSDGQGSGSMVQVRTEPDAPEMTIKLTPMSTITGHVSISNGGDPAELYFHAYKADYRDGHLRWNFAGQAKTDSNGTFRFFEMDAPAKYLICSQQAPEHPAFPSAAGRAYGYPTTCYPSSTTTGSDGLLSLAPGQHAEAEISIARQPFHRVSISTGSALAQGQGFNLYHHNGAPATGSVRWKEDDLSWEAWLPNGTYYAESRSWGDSPTYGRVDFKVADTAVSGLKLAALPLAPIEVVIHKLFTTNNDQQASGHRMFITTGNQLQIVDNPGLQLELIPVEAHLEGSGGGVGLRHSEGDPPDQFEAMGITPGRYWVFVTYVSGGYVSAMTSGATDLTREPLVIGAGNAAPPIEITLRNDGGTIDCAVNNAPNDSLRALGVTSLGFSGPVVYAIPTGLRLSGLPHEFVGSHGSRVTNLAPGLYRVLALRNFRDLDAADPAELANLMAQGTIVRVEAGATTSVQVDFAKDAEPNP